MRGDLDVGGLRRGADDKGEIEEVEIIRGAVSGKVETATETRECTFRFAVELVGVIGGEHDMDEKPRHQNG